MRLASLLPLALAASFACAQMPEATTTVLQHARLIDGNGGTPMADATLVLRGRNIAAINPAKLPAGATIVDLSGKTVMPSIISDHSHLGQIQDGKGGAGLYTRENLLNQLAQWQAYGVDTIVSLGLNDPTVFYPMRAEAHTGTLPGADFFGADRGIGVPNGAPPTPAQPGPYRPATPEEARAAVREMVARHTDLIKVWVDDFHGTMPTKMSPAIYGAVIDEAHRYNVRVAAHVFYQADAKQLVRDGIDILAHGVRDTPVDDEFIALLKQHGTWYIATLDLDEATYLWAQHPAIMDTPFFQHAVSPGLAAHFTDPAWRDKVNGNTQTVEQSKAALAQNKANLKRLVDAGVNVGFGTDSGANTERIPGFAEHRELHLSVEAGLSPMQAITLATKNAAAEMKLTDRGIIAPGKRADLLVLDADPSQDIDNTQTIRAVWHNGKQVSGPVTSFEPR
ncbi:amidohydrolase family protein [Terriglobus aquaticus]|uniref:Amidohydrolase family protein n=1 Tax=Terriglobus aquaticus TaxID=940139 RepID=A0ABW9KM62_9BACT|nr:amidohydrolase family protein [Terriglobus aquaticus]